MYCSRSHTFGLHLSTQAPSWSSSMGNRSLLVVDAAGATVEAWHGRLHQSLLPVRVEEPQNNGSDANYTSKNPLLNVKREATKHGGRQGARARGPTHRAGVLGCQCRTRA